MEKGVTFFHVYRFWGSFFFFYGVAEWASWGEGGGRGAVDEIPALVTPIYNYSDWIQNANQKNSEDGHFSHSDTKENEINIYLTGQ